MNAALAELLEARVGNFATDRIVTFSIIALLFALAIFGTIWFIRRNVTRPVVELAGIIDRPAEDRTMCWKWRAPSTARPAR